MKRVKAEPAKKARKTDKRQNPTAKVAHRATHAAVKKRRKPAPRTPKPPPRDITVPDAIDEAFIEIEMLAQEMRDWADAMEDKFGSTQKYDTVSSTADTLENLTNPMEGISDKDRAMLNELVIVGFQDPTPRRAGYSRSDRCAQACDLLDRAASLLEVEEETEGVRHDLYGEVEEAISECQGIEFPGMYG